MNRNKKGIENRVKEVAEFILTTEGTVRKAADRFGISKSTVHKDLVERLPIISSSKARMVKVILKHNKELRHIRGGYMTKRRWESKKIA